MDVLFWRGVVVVVFGGGGGGFGGCDVFVVSGGGRNVDVSVVIVHHNVDVANLLLQQLLLWIVPCYNKIPRQGTHRIRISTQLLPKAGLEAGRHPDSLPPNLR